MAHNKVISGYFDDAHRNLQRQGQGRGNVPTASSHVQLPPLRSGSQSPIDGNSGQNWNQGMSKSNSMGALEFSHDQLANGVLADRYQQSLMDNSNMSRRLKATQDQLSITTAKKEAFKAQATRLEKEFKKGREQSDSLQKELLEARREAGHCSKEAQESLGMMTEMRKAHIHEVRLLQRGLAARGAGDTASKNKVNEFADLVDKVGRAVVQRDEAIRDKTKMQAQHNKVTTDLRALADETARLRKQNRELAARLKEAERRAKFHAPKAGKSALGSMDSDEEFEQELLTFEKRFEILEEGPAGLDIVASNLSKDKQGLEKRIRTQQETMRMLNKSIEEWKAANSQKDEQISELNLQIEKMLQDQALLHEQIAQKRREIELQVVEEKAKLEKRISELQGEVDLAQSQAEGLEKVSTRLTSELVKVHGQYGTLSSAEPAAADLAAAGETELVLKQDAYQAKTGESITLEVHKILGKELWQLSAAEPSLGEPAIFQVDEALKSTLDAEHPWEDLFTRVGITLGPPKRVVISNRLDQKQVTLVRTEDSNAPGAGRGQRVFLEIFQYDARRFYATGTNIDTGDLVSLVIMEDAMTPELTTILDKSEKEDLYDLLAAGLSLGATGLVFDASRAREQAKAP